MAISRGTSTDYDDLLTKLSDFITGDHVATVAVNAAGTGYVVGDILTVAGGTSAEAAQLEVTTIGGSGDVTGVRIYDSGSYSVDPTLTGNAATGGTGSSATFDLTMETSNWTVNLNDTTLDSSTERVTWFEETVNNVHVGIRTYSVTDGVNTGKNWMLFGATGYNGALPWYNQPDTTPNALDGSGGVDTTPSDFAGMYLKGNDGFAIDYWFWVTNRRIMVMAKLYDAVTTTPRYSSCHIGLLNAFATSSELPYPLYIAGSASHVEKAWNANAPAFQMSGLTTAVGANIYNSPGYYLHSDGQWKLVRNSTYGLGGSNRSERSEYVVYPFGQPDITSAPDVGIVLDSSLGLRWEDMVNHTGNFVDDPDVILYPTPDTGGEKRPLVPCAVIMSSTPESDVDMIGEIDGLYWACAAGATQATSEDTVTDGTDRYIWFVNGTYTNIDGFQLIRED